MQVAHGGLIKNSTILQWENRIRNVAALLNQVDSLWKLISVSVPEHVCVCARAQTYTLDNPHPGRAQTAVFQKTAEGNYKLGRSLDREAGGVLRRIPSPPLQRAKAGLHRLAPPRRHTDTSRRPATSPPGQQRLGHGRRG